MEAIFRNVGPVYLTLSICYGGTLLRTHARREAAVHLSAIFNIDIHNLFRKSLFDTFDQLSYPEDLDQSLDIRKNMQNHKIKYTPLLYKLFGVANGAIIIFNLDYLGLEH